MQEVFAINVKSPNYEAKKSIEDFDRRKKLYIEIGVFCI